MARADDSCQFDGYRSVRIGWLSVWPSRRIWPGTRVRASATLFMIGNDLGCSSAWPGSKKADSRRLMIRPLPSQIANCNAISRPTHLCSFRIQGLMPWPSG